MYFVARTLLVLAIISVTARADAPMTKDQLLDAFIALPSTRQQPAQTIEGIVKNFVGRDYRIPVDQKSTVTEKLAASVSVDRVRGQLRTLIDQNFTQEELDYLIKLRTSAFGRKMETVMPKIFDNLREYTRDLAKAQFEPVTHLKYVDAPQLYPPHRDLPPPRWYTKLIWNWIPSTQNCPLVN